MTARSFAVGIAQVVLLILVTVATAVWMSLW